MEGLFLYKLIILYMLDRIDEYMLTNTQLNDFILDKGYTNNPFNIHESLSELIDAGFISRNVIRDTTHYKITNAGEEALSYFENRLPIAIKQDILDYFAEQRINLKNESQIYSDYFFNDNQEYTVECIIKARKDIVLDLKLSVPTKSLATSICDSWREKSADVYSYLINELFTNEDK